MLRDNFKDFTSIQVDGIRVQGMTLRQRLQKDKSEQRRHDKDSNSMGKKYLAEVRLLYALEGGSTGLKVKDESAQVRVELASALRLARGTPAKRGAILDFLQVGTACNQRELIGLLRYAFELKPWIAGPQQAVSMSILQFLVRTNAATMFPDEMSVYRQLADRILSEALAMMKANAVPLSSFWEVHRHMAHLVTEVALVEKLLAVKGSWSEHQADLETIVDGSELGERMFGFAMYQNMSAMAGKKLQSKINEMLGTTGKLTAATVEACRAAVAKLIGDMPNKSKLSSARIVEVTYRSARLKVEADSLLDEASLRIVAFVKSCAVDVVGEEQEAPLPPVFCELALAPKATNVREVEASLCVAWKVARHCANGLVDEAFQDNADQILQALDKKQGVLLQMDSTFKLEEAFFRHMAAAGSARRLEASVLEKMPNTTGLHSAQQCLADLQEVRQSRLYTFCGAESQSSLNIAMELVQSIAQNRLPTVSVCKGSSFKAEVLNRLAYFAHWEPAQPAGSDDKVGTLNGADAMEKHYLGMVARMALAGATVTMEELNIFHTFNWLLSAEQQAEHNKWVAQAFSGVVGAKASGSKSGGGRKRAGAAQPAEAKNDNKKKKHDNDMALFS